MNDKQMNLYEFHIDMDTETDMSNLNDMVQRLDRIRRETEDLERDIAKIRGEIQRQNKSGSQMPSRIWMRADDPDDHYFMLGITSEVDPEATKYVRADLAGGDQHEDEPKMIPGTRRVTMQEHDGSPNKPERLSDDDELIVEYEHGVKAIRFASVPNWNRVRRYQKLEIK